MRNHFFISNSFVGSKAYYAVVLKSCAFRCDLYGVKAVVLLIISCVFDSFNPQNLQCS